MPKKKSTTEKVPSKNSARIAVKKIAKKAPAKKSVKKAAKKVVNQNTENKPTTNKKSASKKTVKRAAAKSATPTAKRPAASAGFSLEEALSVAKTRKNEDDELAKKRAAKEKERKAFEEAEQRTEKRVLGAASLSDILGFDSMVSAPKVETRPIPKKFKKFYNLLISLRDHVKSELSMHTEETLKRSSKDEAGDLSGYSQHMADAGTDTFDRDFALSMVSNEQDALTEIEAAIERIFEGTYGVCEMTGKNIMDERLMAVPFTRYSIETQKQLEKNQTRSVQRGGVFADASSEDAMNFSEENPDT
ncbi:MAG: TraR/DksA C4-type zinc finger protein [Verrucomicrobiota bacterium]|nr:TraR/DksA C4-type zinc finger protein [Verrucomicrobiota bacterium]